MGLLSGVSKFLFGDPGEGIQESADKSLAYQREALDYLKGVQAPVLGMRNKALPMLGGFYGIGADAPQMQQQFVDTARQNPFYQSMLQQGEEAVLRNAAATGGLRGGNVQQALAQNSQNVLQGLVNQQLQGLGSFAQTPINTQGISSTLQGMGQTQAQAGMGQAQAQQDMMGGLLSLGGALGGAYLMSDIRLKENIVKIGEENGFNLYEWTWNGTAEALGLKGRDKGHIAQEVEKERPDLIGEKFGYKAINYGALQNG